MKSPRPRSIRTFAAGLLVASVSALTGCATMTRGASQAIPVTTSPPGAVVMAGAMRQQSPCVLKLARSRDHQITIALEGYRTETRSVVRQPTNAPLGNIFFGGLIGLLLDAFSGAGNELVPNQIDVQLAPVAAGPGEAKPILAAGP